ncbi:MAG: YbhB/YbcL family Raf kinase inhibitor-like protein [Candidatus Aminicenantes bacterium]|nr:YbhB/YbcL family Raf kinase inhibitor-like protein [Candidatus Aminicenantes bacterium]
MEITSPIFKEGDIIPSQYTCDGPDISPPLVWDDVPKSAKGFVLICDDPDAPMGIWVHWVLYHLPADVKKLPENVPPDEELENGAMQGKNDFGRIGYGGPCPPSGTHRYYFKLYALDEELSFEPGMEKDQLLEAIDGHVLDEATLMGRYQR